MNEFIQKPQNINYLCDFCQQTRNLILDREVHQNRRMLKINGLAPYVDIHYNKEGRGRHGTRIFVDPNFDVRTIENIQKKKLVEDAKPSIIPLPSMKKKVVQLTGDWESWMMLHLELPTSDKEIILMSKENKSISKFLEKQINVKSDLATVNCKSTVRINELTMDTLKFISEWLTSLCNIIESTSSLNNEMVSFILKYIDTRTHRRITIHDTEFITAIVDSSAIIIPDKKILSQIIKYGKGIEFSNIHAEYLIQIANLIILSEQFYFINEITQLTNIMNLANFEEIQLIFYIYHLFLLQAFKYRPSKLLEL